jgi:hypothetical protein
MMDYDTDTALHPFVPSEDAALCAECGEHTSWHPDAERQRECGCPPWIIRCLHWQGLWLVIRTLPEAPPDSVCQQPAPSAAYTVGRVGACSCGCNGYCLDWLSDQTTDLATANRVFEARERELLDTTTPMSQ